MYPAIYAIFCLMLVGLTIGAISFDWNAEVDTRFLSPFGTIITALWTTTICTDECIKYSNYHGSCDTFYPEPYPEKCLRLRILGPITFFTLLFGGLIHLIVSCLWDKKNNCSNICLLLAASILATIGLLAFSIGFTAVNERPEDVEHIPGGAGLILACIVAGGSWIMTLLTCKYPTDTCGY